MRQILLFVLITAIFTSLSASAGADLKIIQIRGGRTSHSHSYSHSSRSGSVSVHGYYRKNGTYVKPHHRSRPNHTKRDNWSTKGNVNPYTGKPGSKEVTE